MEQPTIELLAGTEKNRRYDIQTAAVIHRVLGGIPGRSLDGKGQGVGIDVGAHRGDILRHMVRASPHRRHLAIEPLPQLADELRRTFPTVDVHRAALVAEPDGPVEFQHVTSNPAYSGLRRRRYDRPNETVQSISVPTARLDDLVSDMADAPALVKIDVEGAELGVLRGGQTTIAEHRPVVVFEHGLGAADHYGTTPADVFGFFADCEMVVSLLATWLDDGPALSRDQFAEQFHTGVNYYFIASV